MKKYIPMLVIGILILAGLSCRATDDLGRVINPKPIFPVATLAVQMPQNPLPDLINNTSQDALVAIYERVSPGVVSIQVLTADGGGQGSGFVYNQDGYIITNKHVIEGAEDIYINFSSGLKVHGEVKAEDPDSDLALIKVNVPADQLFPLTLGDSNQLKVGQTVVAIGNPFGLSGTMTSGIVSAKGRLLESLRLTSEGRSFSAGDIIQTDASINPGNSGGPLLNLNGEVVGINRAIRTSGTDINGDPVNSGIGFAISINIVKKVVPTLIEKGTYDYPYLGVSAREELSLLEIESLGLDQTTGAYVVEVVSGGPADRSGIKAGSRPTKINGLYAGGDLIIAIDDQPVRVFGDLLSYLMTTKSPGETVNLTVLRDGKQMNMEVVLEKRP